MKIWPLGGSGPSLMMGVSPNKEEYQLFWMLFNDYQLSFSGPCHSLLVLMCTILCVITYHYFWFLLSLLIFLDYGSYIHPDIMIVIYFSTTLRVSKEKKRGQRSWVNHIDTSSNKMFSVDGHWRCPLVATHSPWAHETIAVSQSVRPQLKFSYFPSLDFYDFLHPVIYMIMFKKYPYICDILTVLYVWTIHVVNIRVTYFWWDA